MEYKEYALAKLEGYKTLGWEIVGFVETDDKIYFKSKDLNLICREHEFTGDSIKINEINIDTFDQVEIVVAAKKTKKTKKVIE